MDLRFTPDELAFREEVRGFIRRELPEVTRRKMLAGKRPSKDEIVAWQRILNRQGWAVYNWPREWGGAGWSPVQQYIFQEELQQTPAPQPLAFGVTMVGPVIIAAGSEAQKKQFLPRIANLDDWWCQGFLGAGRRFRSRGAAHLCQARRRPLRRQRPEDLDHPRPIRRLDLLSGTHRSSGKEAGRYLFPIDRHEVERNHGAPDRHDRWRA
jgi:alkylation response protein AidB-like acyl-CoA dehydrogenase